MHLMVVCLHCMGGVIDLTRLSDVSHSPLVHPLSPLLMVAQYLKISVTRLVSLSREVGCSVLSKKTTKTNEENKSQQTDRNIAQISFPLRFPERRKAKGGRR
jgi:hypothetical protein